LKQSARAAARTVADRTRIQRAAAHTRRDMSAELVAVATVMASAGADAALIKGYAGQVSKTLGDADKKGCTRKRLADRNREGKVNKGGRIRRMKTHPVKLYRRERVEAALMVFQPGPGAVKPGQKPRKLTAAQLAARAKFTELRAQLTRADVMLAR
jgi:hypothetical protein